VFRHVIKINNSQEEDGVYDPTFYTVTQMSINNFYDKFIELYDHRLRDIDVKAGVDNDFDYNSFFDACWEIITLHPKDQRKTNVFGRMKNTIRHRLFGRGGKKRTKKIVAARRRRKG